MSLRFSQLVKGAFFVGTGLMLGAGARAVVHDDGLRGATHQILAAALDGGAAIASHDKNLEGPPRDPASKVTRPAIDPARLPRAPTAASQSLFALAEHLDMPGGVVDNPCLSWAGPRCEAYALDAFFRSLDNAASHSGNARVVVLGNSLIASDRITNIWRDRFVERFGDGGRGFLLTDRMAEYGPRHRTGRRTSGWGTHNIAMGSRGHYPHGLSGVLHVSTSKARTEWGVMGADHAQFFYWGHERAPALTLAFDSAEPLRIEPANAPGPGRVELVVPQGVEKLTLRSEGSRGVVYGVSLEKRGQGFILDTMGVPAVDGSIFLSEDPEVAEPQLKALQPHLVAVMLGGNEIKRIAWGKSSVNKVRTDTGRLLQWLKRTAPDASCLVVGPIENVKGKSAAKPLATRWQTHLVNHILEEQARENGCAFFDLFAAMGGSGALRKLNARRMLHDDLVHPRGRGLDLPGELIARGLFQSYEKTRVPTPQEPWRNFLRARYNVAVRAAPDSAAAVDHALGRARERLVHVHADGLPDGLFTRLKAHLVSRFGSGGSGHQPLGYAMKRSERQRVRVPEGGRVVRLWYRAERQRDLTVYERVKKADVFEPQPGLYVWEGPVAKVGKTLNVKARRAGVELVGIETLGERGVVVENGPVPVGHGGPDVIQLGRRADAAGPCLRVAATDGVVSGPCVHVLTPPEDPASLDDVLLAMFGRIDGLSGGDRVAAP